MQLTNISRDVKEDQEMGRRYIPATRGAPKAAVAGLLAKAEHYYESAEAGLPHIPLRTRPAIAVAMAVYRQIGRRLLRHGGDPMLGRTVVPMWEKLLVGFKALIGLPFASRTTHQTTLHSDLKGLPGCAT
jgi:phytoene synthase